MRNLIKAAFAVIIATMAISCTKEIQEVVENNNATIDVCIDGTIEGYSAQEETKASAKTVIRIDWVGGETVYVYDGVTPIGSLTATKGDADGTYAKLSGTITAPSGNKPITLVYSPQFKDVPAVSEGKISLDLSLQDEAEVPFLIYGVLPAVTASAINDAVVKFSLATSVYKCNCANLPEGELTKAEINKTNTICDIILSDTSKPTVGGSNSGSIIRTSGFTTANKDQRAIFTVALAISEETANRIIEVTKGAETYETRFANTAFAPAKSYNSVLMFINPVPKDGLPGKFTINAKGGQVFFSQGNLWYGKESNDAESAAFHFENHQWEVKTSGRNDSWVSDHVCHFHWSKDASVASAHKFLDPEEGSGFLFTNKDETTPNPDFMVNGRQGKWRVLSGGENGEWNYLLNLRAMKYGKPRYTNKTSGIVLEENTYNGLFLYPDNYYGEEIGKAGAPDTWKKINDAGIVFLPAGGVRGQGTIAYFSQVGYYWFSKPGNCVEITSSEVETHVHPNDLGYSIRLVWDYAPAANQEQ